MKGALWYIIIILGIGLFVSLREITTLNGKLNTAMANIKSYDAELGDSKKKNIAYKFTVEQLESYQDSILRELDATRKKLKIKDNKVQSVQYVASSFIKTDTLVINDTIFKETSFALDTLIQDDWSSVRIGLKYPATIAVQPKFKSEKHIVISAKRETVNPPKKFFLFRWFQKKHTVIRVDVVEKNPYVTEESSKYVEIVK